MDRTYFIEGGGQPADNGTIGNAFVSDVQDVNGDVVHYTDKAFDVGEQVHGKVDILRRHTLMQQHSGEHIVSGLIHNKFGYDNVGFHMGSECITIDFNGVLTADDLADIEKEPMTLYMRTLNRRFLPVKGRTGQTGIQKQKELEGDVRIVSFGSCDTCACCGLHVVRTGEIGLIKITGFQKYKGGTRGNNACRKTGVRGLRRKGQAKPCHIGHAFRQTIRYTVGCGKAHEGKKRNKGTACGNEEKLFALKETALTKTSNAPFCLRMTWSL